MSSLNISMSAFGAVSSFFTSVVVLCGGLALLSAKTTLQVATIALSCITFAGQRTVFVAILDLDAPVTSCAATNAVSYTFIVIMRLSIMVGLASRALGANRQLKIVALNVGVGISIAIGLASIGLLLWIAFTTKLIKSNDNVDFCLQDLPHIPVIVNNVMFLFSGSCLTFLMAYPIQKSLTAAAVQHAALRQISSANPLPLTKTHNQARVMLKLARIIPIVMPTALFIVSMISHLTNLPSVFYATLVFSDFAGMLLLLFPIIVLSGDNGEAIAAARYVKSKVPLGETRPQAYSAPSSVAANTTFNATTADTSMTEAPSSSGTVTEGLSQGLRASRGPGATTMMINGRPVVVPTNHAMAMMTSYSSLPAADDLAARTIADAFDWSPQHNNAFPM